MFADYSMTRVLAGWVEFMATVVMLFFSWKLRDNSVLILPILTWWASVSGVVLTLYGAKRITDKKLNKEGAE
jgi:hypothetical protein